jgi:hypothetical protein
MVALLVTPQVRQALLRAPDGHCADALTFIDNPRLGALRERYQLSGPFANGEFATVHTGIMPRTKSGVQLPGIGRPGARIAVKVPAHRGNAELDRACEDGIRHEAKMLSLVFRAERDRSHLFVRGIQDPALNVLLLEYTTGSGTLAEWMVEPVARKRSEVRRLLSELDDARAILKHAGVVHGDINPDNILVLPDGSIRIIDFGLAAPVGGRPPHLGGRRAGNPSYRSWNQNNDGPAQLADDDYAFAEVRKVLEIFESNWTTD